MGGRGFLANEIYFSVLFLAHYINLHHWGSSSGLLLLCLNQIVSFRCGRCRCWHNSIETTPLMFISNSLFLFCFLLWEDYDVKRFAFDETISNDWSLVNFLSLVIWNNTDRHKNECALLFDTVYNKSNVWSVSFDGPFFPRFPIDDVNPSKSENLLFLALCLSFVCIYTYMGSTRIFSKYCYGRESPTLMFFLSLSIKRQEKELRLLNSLRSRETRPPSS